ncbi:hypothetical protein B0I72DRAFT_162036 [Yarrowia lipolytica]|jgi:hypothetical protein|uniref:YALI0C23518p n=2 Tax=Yarrowia lipolytica TaxID=4952 RepID=Q6CAX7_YARLI|nr:YALI0C23518p [Yarrowia lipolytica CLIB122]AOW03311.1 hypothetical protein YALI1_C32461g [Yarrowia lipolytica]KAB8280157.1 hypothetical protein BKA91DRAFT_164423 [Yarrowia lipolytica]KAE8170234.1 hypothetical protein BKA90DRAFT_158682 [Yarrowia lipolytica]KAJ8053793.1 hypothetical protein LXG23DRAFT_23441 [Yarrowia lipolytica]QNP96003.1 Hypothetical protein YALI2_B00308g [Yarrowia lipolytica]|eukprot:XP_502185.1 YALI0C23518p [Yarrowia lipolytica CLIB122]
MTTFYLGYSKKSITSNSSSVISSVYNSSDEFQDAERAWDPTDHLVNVVTRRGDPRDRAAPTTPVLSRSTSAVDAADAAAATIKALDTSKCAVLPSDQVADRAPPRTRAPHHISLPCSNTFMAHGLPTCDDLEMTKEFDFAAKPASTQKNLPKAPLDFLVQRPPSPPYSHVSVPQNSPLSGTGTPSTHGVLKTHDPVALDEMLESSFASHAEDDEEMAAFLDDEDDYPASNEEDDEEEDAKDTFYICSETIKAAHESVLDLRALLEDKFSLIPGESVESLEKRALRMVHLEESFSVQDSFEPRTLLADQNRAFIPWKPVIEDLELYFEMRYPDLPKGSNRYEFHRARLVRNRTRLRILAQYVADLEEKSRNLCRLSRSF